MFTVLNLHAVQDAGKDTDPKNSLNSYYPSPRFNATFGSEEKVFQPNFVVAKLGLT